VGAEDMSKEEFPKHINSLVDNTKEVNLLTDIHSKIAGKDPGRKTGVEVLNKSAVVLLVACWESYVEELAAHAFSIMLKYAKQPSIFPTKVLTLASKEIKNDSDETRVWQLAGKGWKDILEQHKDNTLKKHLSVFNTPKTANINNLYLDLLGVKRISKDWNWATITSQKAEAKLDAIIALRGQIAHEVKTTESVHKELVVKYSHFIKRLAGLMSNSVADHMQSRTGKDPWVRVTYTADK
jgi:hypothetical protein